MVAESLAASSLDKIRAAPAGPPRGALEGVQVLRGVAALAVVVHHALEELSGAGLPEFVTRAGAAGVDLFFVISGFIMLHTTAGQFGIRGAGRDFLARRLIRIAPLYWLVTAFVLVCHVTGVAYANREITLDGTIRSFMFAPTPYIVVNVGWTLNFEMYFYVLFAACLALGRSTLAAVGTPAMILAGLALGRLAPEDSAWRALLTDPIALEFVFGMGLAALFRAGRIERRWAWPALTAGAAALVAASAWAPPQGTAGLASSVRFLTWGLPAVLVVYAALSTERVRTRFGRAWLALGDASYSLYLSHAVVMTTFAKLLKLGLLDGLPVAVLFAVVLAVAVATGQLCYVLVERPITEGLKGAWSRRRKALAEG